mmetsp:Transcript_7519/g.17058  ORF Transcript_7519/g.17058 Transcript_7519/m.17058 type:complete len:286 (+) Transcript_7519:432-1289(+)
MLTGQTHDVVHRPPVVRSWAVIRPLAPHSPLTRTPPGDGGRRAAGRVPTALMPAPMSSSACVQRSSMQAYAHPCMHVAHSGALHGPACMHARRMAGRMHRRHSACACAVHAEQLPHAAISACRASSSSSSGVFFCCTALAVGALGSLAPSTLVFGTGAGSSSSASSSVASSSSSSPSSSSSSSCAPRPVGLANTSLICCICSLVSLISSSTSSTLSTFISFMFCLATLLALCMVDTTSTAVRWLSSMLRCSMTRMIMFSRFSTSFSNSFFFFRHMSACCFLPALL